MTSPGDNTEVLLLYLKVLGKSKRLLLKLSEKYQRLSEVNPYKSRTLIYYHSKRLEKLGLIECITISRAKFCKLTEQGKALKEIALKLEQKRKAKKEGGKVTQPVDVLEQLRALQAFSWYSWYSKRFDKR